MVQFYPSVSSVYCHFSGQIVLRPWIGRKSLEQIVLYRQQDCDLISEKLLEWYPAVGQTGPEFPDHFLLALRRQAMSAMPYGAEVMPFAQAQAIRMTEPAAGVGDMLDSGMHIQPADQQAAQTAAIFPDDRESLAILARDRDRVAYHCISSRVRSQSVSGLLWTGRCRSAVMRRIFAFGTPVALAILA